MANKNQANGLKPHGQILRSRPYVAGSTVYPGDALALAADGQVDVADTGALIGVAANYATSGNTVMVFDDPNQLFEVEANAAIALADVGLNAVLAGSGSPSTAYKRSGQYLDSTGTAPAATSTYNLQILAHVQQIDNTANSANNDVIVRINVHQLNNAGRTGI